MEKLVDYYTAVLERGEVLPSKNHIADDAQQPTIPAEVYAVVLAGKSASLRRIDMQVYIKDFTVGIKKGLLRYASGICCLAV